MTTGRSLFIAIGLPLAWACSGAAGPGGGAEGGAPDTAGTPAANTAGGHGDGAAADAAGSAQGSSETGVSGAHVGTNDSGGGSEDGSPAGSGNAPSGSAADGASGAGASDAAAVEADATAAPVLPVQVAGNSQYQFAFGDLVLEVDPQVGGRVSALSIGGTGVLAPRVSDRTQWGSTFWTAPQADWKPQTWPPPASIDADPYSGGPSGAHLVLTSAVDPAMGFSVTKDYSADASTGSVNILYKVHPTAAMQAAPWENTRVPRGGLAFFPAGATLSPGPLTLSTVAGVVWFDDSSKSATSTNGSKSTADGSGGWLAYAVDGVLFLKRFMDEPASALAPVEGEVDIYPGPSFLELEVLGPYTSIAAGGDLSWNVQWRVARIPSSVVVASGSSTLLDFAMQQAASR